MKNIDIVIEPPVEPRQAWDPQEEINFSRIFWKLQDANHHLFDLTFILNSGNIHYYPANLGTIIGDLYREYELSSNRIDHNVEFSGYTVAIATIWKNDIVFLKAGYLSVSSSAFGQASLNDYLHQLRQTIGSALAYIEELEI